MDNPVTGLQIKQVAVRTGLSEQLIRKWEQRYQAVTPRRLHNGYRVYQEQDVRTLMAITQLVERGVPVRRAVALVTAERASEFERVSGFERSDVPRRLGESDRDRPSEKAAVSDPQRGRGGDAADGPCANPLQAVVNAMLAAGAIGDLQRLETILQRCFVTEGMRAAVDGVLTPFLQEVGWLWSTGEWSEDQEHLSSLTVRNFLVRRMADLPDAPSDAPVLLASCVPGERHDIMLQITLLEAKRLGWRTLFLGPDPAPGAIERALARLSPDVLLLSITTRHEELEGSGPGCGDEIGAAAIPIDGRAASSERRAAAVSRPGRTASWFEKLSDLVAGMPSTEVYLGGPTPLVHCCVDGLCHINPLESLADCLDVLARRTLASRKVN